MRQTTIQSRELILQTVITSGKIIILNVVYVHEPREEARAQNELFTSAKRSSGTLLRRSCMGYGAGLSQRQHVAVQPLERSGGGTTRMIVSSMLIQA
jgi:hypothetical protein